MIDYNPKDWIKLIFSIHTSETLWYLFPFLVFMGAYTAGIWHLFHHFNLARIPVEVSLHSLLGIVLGFVLVFRTNTAYARWWEGRILWGNLINHSRNFALKSAAVLLEKAKAERAYLADGISNFAIALKEHLRDGVKWEELKDGEFLKELRDQQRNHVPNMITFLLIRKVKLWLDQGTITGDEYRELIRETNGLTDVLGGCERILKTPIPYAYSAYVKKVIFVYLISLPVSFMGMGVYYAVPAVMFITYVLLAIELIGETIEDPFGLDSSDLDTDGMANTITGNAKEILCV